MNSRKHSQYLAATALALMACLFGAGCSNQRVGADVMATVNNRKITRDEVEKYYKNQTAEAQQAISDEQAENLRLNILHGLIDNEILMQRAEKLGLLATDDEVNAKLTETKAPFTQEEFDKQLKERGLTLDDLKREIRQQLTIQKVLNREIVSKINITDDEITNYYNAHKAEFNLIEPRYHLAQILVTTTPNPQIKSSDKAQNEPDARRKISAIYNRLQSGEDFESAAMHYSEQPESAQSGGDLGWVPESSIKAQPAAYDAIQKLKPGQFTPPMPIVDPNSRQVAGYRILKLVGKEPAGQRELKDPGVQQQIRGELRDRREQLLKSAFYEWTRDQAKVENYYADEILKKAGTGK